MLQNVNRIFLRDGITSHFLFMFFLIFQKFPRLFLKSVRKISHQNCFIFNTRISKWKNIVPYFAQSDESLSVKLHQYIKLNLIN